jgi:hypothetical protein
VLEWLSELLGGIKVFGLKRDKDWLYRDAYDSSIIVLEEGPGGKMQVRPPSALLQQLPPAPSSSNNTFSGASTGNSASFLDGGAPPSPSSLRGVEAAEGEGGQQGQALEGDHLSAATSKFSIEHSPIMNLYLNLGRRAERGDLPYLCSNPCKTFLSHTPNHPVTTMQPETLTSLGNFREKKVVPSRLKGLIKDSVLAQREMQVHKLNLFCIDSFFLIFLLFVSFIFFQARHAEDQKALSADLKKLRDTCKLQIALLRNKSPTNKDILAAAAAESAKF